MKVNVPEMLALYQQGTPIRKLACKYNCCEMTIRYHLHKNGAFKRQATSNASKPLVALRAACVSAQVYLDIGDLKNTRLMLSHMESILLETPLD